MAELRVNNNLNLFCLPPLEKFTGSNWTFSVANTAITCLPNVIQHTGYILGLDGMPLCGIFGNGCQVAWNIAGNLFGDDDGDCIGGNTEAHIQNVKLELFQGGDLQQQVYSNGAGDYSFNTNLGIYQTLIDTTGLPFNVGCPINNSHISNLITTDSLDFNADFALQCKPGYDVAVQSICQIGGMLFPMHHATVSIRAGDLVHYYGTGCNTNGLSGTVTAIFAGPVSVSSVTGNGLVAGNTIAWNVNDFSQLDFFNDFFVTFLTDTFPPQGSQVCVDVNVTANSGTDNNSSNNSLTQCFNVVNSFDPNFKEVYPSTVSQPGDWHTYTVHFQNTGTAPAQHVQVIDTLDSNLDWSSFQLLAYSHENLTQVLNNGIVHFNFPNINLPDSTSDEPNSHGWVQYRIKTKSDIQPGTTIHNTASIYFDFNAPVVTNDAVVDYECVPQTVSQNLPLCQGDSVQVGSNWYLQAGTYTNALTTATGCDSVVITNLSVLQPSSSQQSYSICQGDSVQVDGVWRYESGTFVSSFPNAAGCDSTVTTHVALLTPSAFDQSVSLCAGATVTVGNNTYDATGTYTDILQNAAGCDSIVQTAVAVASIDTSLTVSGPTLAAAADAGAYQWIDCVSHQPVTGATNASYTAASSGSYAATLTYGTGCTTSTACADVVVNGIASVPNIEFTLAPNPASDHVVLALPNDVANLTIVVTDLTGRRILERKAVGASQVSLSVDALLPGTYLVQFDDAHRTLAVKQLVIIRTE